MKKAGIFIVAVALVLFVCGMLMPEEAKEDRYYIHAAIEMKEVASASQTRSSADALNRQTDELVSQLGEKLALRGEHFILAGAFSFPLGCALWLIGWQWEANRRKVAPPSESP